jgi:hypothetical protein
MSKEAFVDFYENYLNSPSGEELRARINGVKSGEEFLSIVTGAGKTAGFNFTEHEAQEVMRASEAQMAKALAEASGELSDDQLEKVAGGATSYLSSSIPTVSLSTTTTPSYLDPKQFEYSTVMCPW